MAKEEELIAAKNKADTLEKENSSIAALLAKKEQELDLRNQEKVSVYTLFFEKMNFSMIHCTVFILGRYGSQYFKD